MNSFFAVNNIQPGLVQTRALLGHLKKEIPFFGTMISIYTVSCSSWFRPLGMAGCSYCLFQMMYRFENPNRDLKPAFEELSRNPKHQEYAQRWLRNFEVVELINGTQKKILWWGSVACGILAVASAIETLYLSIFKIESL